MNKNSEEEKLQNFWQSGKNSLSANMYMFENQMYTDVQFEIKSSSSNGESSSNNSMILFAHKYILISRSPVFEAMLLSNMIESSLKDGKSCITISDIDVDAFKETLRFMYYNEANINFQNVCSLMYASKKYFLEDLTNHCKKFLEQNIEINNVCEIIDHSLAYNETELTKKCLIFISSNVKNVFDHETFLNLSHTALEQIINYDYLYMESESWLYKECLRWARNKLSSNPIPVDGHDCPSDDDAKLRTILGNIIYKIRFLNMTAKDFARDVGKSKILTDSEKSLLYYHLIMQENLPDDSPFNQNDRIFKCSRFTDTGKAQQWWSCNGPSDALDFSIDADIYLVAVALYGGKCCTTHDVKLEILLGETSKCEPVEEIINSDGSDNLRPIFLTNPVIIEAKSNYTILVTMKGTLTHYGMNGSEVVSSAGVTFSFKSSTKSANGTNVKSGQIPQLIFTRVKKQMNGNN